MKLFPHSPRISCNCDTASNSIVECQSVTWILWRTRHRGWELQLGKDYEFRYLALLHTSPSTQLLHWSLLLHYEIWYMVPPLIVHSHALFLRVPSSDCWGEHVKLSTKFSRNGRLNTERNLGRLLASWRFRQGGGGLSGGLHRIL